MDYKYIDLENETVREYLKENEKDGIDEDMIELWEDRASKIMDLRKTGFISKNEFKAIHRRFQVYFSVMADTGSRLRINPTF